MSAEGSRAMEVATVIAFIAVSTTVMVLATEVVMVLFLALVFGIFLAKLASILAQRVPFGFHASLATIVTALVALLIAIAALFFVQINDRVAETEKQIRRGAETLGNRIEEYPAAKSMADSIPLLSDFLDVKGSDAGKNSSDENQRSAEAFSLDQVPSPVQGAATAVGSFFRSTLGVGVNLMLIFFVGLFLASSPTSYRDGIVKLVPDPQRRRAREVLTLVSETLWRWTIGRLATMAITGFGAFVVLATLGVPLAGTVGILTGLLSFIPNIGAVVSMLIAVLCALPQGAGQASLVAVSYGGLQLIESYLVTPLIQKRQVSLPPALLLSFQAIMGVMFGFLGAVIASPLLAAGKRATELLYIEDRLGG